MRDWTASWERGVGDDMMAGAGKIVCGFFCEVDVKNALAIRLSGQNRFLFCFVLLLDGRYLISTI